MGPDGIEPATRQPFSDLIGTIDVEASAVGDRGVVSVLTQPPADRPVGTVFEMYYRGVFAEVFAAG